MPIVIQPYREVHEAAVREFNQRLTGTGASQDLVFFTKSQPQWLPKAEGSNLYQEFFVALEGSSVRGGYAMKYQDFSFANGETCLIGYYHHPVSEGIVNSSYATVGAMLLKDAMNRSSLLYCLGMGGYDRPLPKMLIRLGWSHFAVPFYFHVVHPSRFLRHIEAARTSLPRKIAMDLAAFSGLGWAGIKAAQGLKKLGSPQHKEITADRFEAFEEWADPLWERAKRHYTMTAVRDCRNLQRLYPASEAHLIRVRVRRGPQDLGWAVVAERRKGDKYGDLRVGSIVDCWAEPENAAFVMRAATEVLSDLGMDLIVSNQSHATWAQALEHSGFLSSDSNFILAAGKKLSGLLEPFAEQRPRVHFTRADGDGLPRNF